jgi:hypothetical protein
MRFLQCLSKVSHNIVRLVIQENSAIKNFDHRLLSENWQLLLLTIPFLLFIVHTFHYIPEVVDDAFITFRYALNLAMGNGMVFNVGEIVEGTSAPLFTVILATILTCTNAAPADLLDITRIINVSSSLLSMLIVYVMAIKIYRLPLYAGLLILLGIALNPYFAFWSMNGMETNFHGFLLLAILSAFEYSKLGPASNYPPLKNNVPTNIKALSLIIAGVFIICSSRPEAPAFIGAYVAYRIVDSIIIRHYQQSFQWAVAGITGLALVLAARYSYYGEIFPNTYYAKMPAVGAWREGGWKYLETFFAGTPLIALLNVVSGIGLLTAFRRDHIIHLILISGCFFFAYYSNGDWMFNFRFAIAALPSYVLLLVSGLFAWRNLLEDLPKPTTQVVAVLLFGALITSWSNTFLIYRDRTYFIWDPSSTKKESLLPGYLPGDLVRPLIVYPGIHVLNYCDANERVMMPDIGFPAFIADNPVLDSRGLTDHATARSLYYRYRNEYAERAKYWDSELIRSLDLDPPCAVTLRPKVYSLGERHFTANMIDDYVKIDERTYVRKPAQILPIATRVTNWEKAWSRMPRSKLITFSYIDTLVEARDIDALSRLESYYEDKPRQFKQFKAILRRALNSIGGA